MKPLRLGVVGTGPWGRIYVRTIAGMREVTLARVAGRADWRDLLRAGDVDALVVAVPPAAQPEIALAAIEAGRPLLLEKPLALSLEAAERIVAAAAARSVLVMVDHVHLFHPAWEALKRAAAQRGPVRSIDSAAGNLGPYRAGVSTLWDWGPHDVAMCLDLLGAPEAVDAERLDARPAGAALAEHLRLTLRFAAGVTARIELNTLREKHRRFSAQLDSGALVYDGAPPADAAELPLTRALRTFAAAARAGSASLEGARLGAQVVRVLAACDARIAGKSGTFARQS